MSSGFVSFGSLIHPMGMSKKNLRLNELHKNPELFNNPGSEVVI